MPQDNSFLTSSEGIDRSGDWVANIARHASQVTSDGRHLVFQSYGSLTGYDNKYKGVSEPEVFVYSAEDARLACASCDPTGAPPANPEPPPGASKLPASTINVETYAPRLISENGSRVFFVSAQALASRDTNGAPDVYEWEREGEGSCTPRTPARANAGFCCRAAVVCTARIWSTPMRGVKMCSSSTSDDWGRCRRPATTICSMTRAWMVVLPRPRRHVRGAARSLHPRLRPLGIPRA
jgi:hypothetical protein